MSGEFQKIDARVGDNVYKVGSAVPEDGFYVCVPCGNKKYLKAGARFTGCLMCFGKERKLFRKGLELWEKFSGGKNRAATDKGRSE